jgi:colicin V production protein
MNPDTLPFNWFDVVFLTVVVVGLLRGRKRGMSEELLSVLMWLTIAFGCGLLYGPIGGMIAQGSVFSELASYLIAYLGIALIIAASFAGLKRAIGGKLVGSDVFGQSEFYLGMVAGMVRFVCILISVLALLNARSYSSADIKAEYKYQNDVYGSNFFPTLYSVQSQVFEKSFVGPIFRQNLGFLLIKPTPPEQKQIKRKEIAYP